MDAAWIQGEEIASYDLVKSLTYLGACLDESLRLLPPVAFGLNRETPFDGLMIDGHWIPGKTLVAVPAYTAHRNEDYFLNPENFEPERWLRTESKAAQVSYIPFSAGARGCIGRNITFMEQRILMATLIHHYDFDLDKPQLGNHARGGF